MIPIAGLKDIHARRAGVVMGGGPSLASDLKAVQGAYHAPLRIAVNHHGLEFGRADYTVFLDDMRKEPEKWNVMRSKGGVLVSQQAASDVDLSRADWWRGRFSGHLGCWLACYLGCNPVLLCGMDCYQNPMPAGEDPSWAYVTPLYELLGWWQEAFRACPHPVRIKAVSGPLVGVFGEWKGL